MRHRTFEDVLASCLRDIEQGNATLSDYSARYPQHAEALRQAMAMQGALEGMEKWQPSSTAQARGRAQMLAALAEISEGGTRRMHPLSPLLTKAAAVLAAGALLVGGSATITSAFGGPNVPARVLALVGAHTSDDHGSADTDTQNDGHDEDTPAAATASPTATAETAKFMGLCNAYFEGSATGQANKRDAQAFKDLEQAAGGAGQVSSFCASLKASATPSAAGEGHGKPSATGTPSANATQAAGNAAQGMGNAGTHPNSNGVDNASPHAALGSGNAPTATPTPVTGSSEHGVANSAGADHADPRAAAGSSNSGR